MYIHERTYVHKQNFFLGLENINKNRICEQKWTIKNKFYIFLRI